MFGGDDDLYGAFNHMHQHMRQMDRMMESMMDPFGMMGGMGMPMGRNMIENTRRQPPQQQMAMASPFSPFGGMMGMGGFGGIFSAMNQLQNQAMNDPNAHIFSQSTMMTFDEDGQPRVVKKTMNKRGDVREERREVRDGGEQSMSIGHSIGDRTHIIEKKRDKDGNVRRQQKFVNLDESVAPEFDREFQDRVRSTRSSYGGRPSQLYSVENGDNGYGRERSNNRGGVSYRDGTSDNAPIITLPEEDEYPRRSRNVGGSTSSSTASGGGPVIREISDEEAESSVSKKRRDGSSHFFHPRF